MKGIKESYVNSQTPTGYDRHRQNKRGGSKSTKNDINRRAPAIQVLKKEPRAPRFVKNINRAAELKNNTNRYKKEDVAGNARRDSRIHQQKYGRFNQQARAGQAGPKLVHGVTARVQRRRAYYAATRASRAGAFGSFNRFSRPQRDSAYFRSARHIIGKARADLKLFRYQIYSRANIKNFLKPFSDVKFLPIAPRGANIGPQGGVGAVERYGI